MIVRCPRLCQLPARLPCGSEAMYAYSTIKLNALLCSTYTVPYKKKRTLRCAYLVSTVLKLGSTIPISDIPCPFALATALEKCIINCFRKAQSSCVEWIISYFDSHLIIFASFFEFQTNKQLVETPVVTGVTVHSVPYY